jgi:hypothetical protein
MVFDERAEVSGKYLLGTLKVELSTCAKSNRYPIDCEDEFLRHKNSVRTYHHTTFRLGIHKLLNPKPMHFAHDKIEMLHPLGTVFLGQENVLISPTQKRPKSIAGLEIKTQIRPRLCVI